MEVVHELAEDVRHELPTGEREGQDRPNEPSTGKPDIGFFFGPAIGIPNEP